jgi:signal transduction histidine kinase
MEESEKVLTMLKTLMDISEAETGTMRLEITSFPVAGLVRDVLDLYQFIAEDKGVSLHWEVSDSLMLDADRPRIQQALANLVDNAIKYTPSQGRVTIRAHQETLDGSSAPVCVITVQDTGAGISDEDIPRIWDRLYRGDKSRHEKGLGLGLSLVKAVVQAHRGQVAAVSRPEEGATFSITLPCFQAAPLLRPTLTQP